MKYDNQLNIKQLRMLFIISFTGGSSSLFYTLYIGHFTDHYIVFTLSILLLSLYLFMAYIKLGYVYFSDAGTKIIIRHYLAHPFFGKNIAVEIPKNALAKFEVKESFRKQKCTLYISQRTKKGNLQFDPISLSALTPKDRMRILQALRVIRQKQSKRVF